MQNTMFNDFLRKRQQDGLWRARIILEDDHLSFNSNDYLCLSKHPEVKKACENGLKEYGVGAGSSQLLGGYTHAHHALEEELADFLGYEKVLLFSTGYMANLGVITSLFGAKDINVFVDRLSHASIIDGVRYSGARCRRFQHLDLNSLERLFADAKTGNNLIISEGVFSMNGDFPELNRLVKITKKTIVG